MDRLNEIVAELERLAAIDEPTEDDEQLTRDLMAEADTLRFWGAADEWRAAEIDKIRQAAANPANLHAGDNRDAGFAINARVDDDPYSVSVRDHVPESELRDRAHQAVEQVRSLEPDQAEKASRLADDPKIARHILATGRPEYREAFRKYMLGREQELTADEIRAVEEVRAASLTDASGGYTIPFLLDSTIVLTNTGTNNPFRMISRVVTGTSDVWNGITSAGVTASWDAEGVEVGDDAPTLAQPTVTAHKAAAFVPFSIEIGEDWPAMEGDIRTMFADARDRLEGAGFATGTGSGQPYGIVTALDANTNVEISMTTNSSIAIADVYTGIESLPPRFRTNASWVMNYTILGNIRRLGTSSNYHGFTVDLTAEGIPQLLGKPVYESSDMSGLLDTATNNSIVVGDFSQYLIYDRVGQSVELIPHLFHTTTNRPSGQRGLYTYWRVGADSIVDTAFRLVQNPA